MPEQIHGAASAQQSLSGDLNTFIVFTKSDNAASDINNATGVNINVTGNLADESQKNFEVLVQSIGLRAMPVVMNNPQATADLSLVGSASLTGEGYRWMFSTEREDVFSKFLPDNIEDPIGLLVDELNGIVLPNGVVLDTSPGGNIEFIRRDMMC